MTVFRKTVTGAKGGVTTYTYDAAHDLKTIKDPRNITYLTVDYDANGRVQKQTQADASTYQFAYVADGNGNVTQTTVTDPNGNQRRVNFNGDGYSTSEIAALGKPEQKPRATSGKQERICRLRSSTRSTAEPSSLRQRRKPHVGQAPRGDVGCRHDDLHL